MPDRQGGARDDLHVQSPRAVSLASAVVEVGPGCLRAISGAPRNPRPLPVLSPTSTALGLRQGPLQPLYPFSDSGPQCSRTVAVVLMVSRPGPETSRPVSAQVWSLGGSGNSHRAIGLPLSSAGPGITQRALLRCGKAWNCPHSRAPDPHRQHLWASGLEQGVGQGRGVGPCFRRAWRK